MNEENDIRKALPSILIAGLGITLGICVSGIVLFTGVKVIQYLFMM